MTYSVSLPPRRKKERHKEVERREFPSHRRFVRSHTCVVPKCIGTPIEFCHGRFGLPLELQGGMGHKPHDAVGFPACAAHHRHQHLIGESAFERKYGVRLLDTALALARVSPCQQVRDKAKGIQL